MGTKEAPAEKIKSHLENVISKFKEDAPNWNISIWIWRISKVEDDFGGYHFDMRPFEKLPCVPSPLTLRVNFSIFCEWGGESLSESDFQSLARQFIGFMDEKCKQVGIFNFYPWEVKTEWRSVYIWGVQKEIDYND